MPSVTEKKTWDPVVSTWLILVQILALAGIIYLIFWRHDWRTLVLTASLVVLSGFCITGGYHRHFTHQSFKCARWLKYYFLCGGAASGQGPALVWIANHCEHHRFSDKAGDPHNIHEGFWWAHMGWMFYRHAPDLEGLPDSLRKKPGQQNGDRELLAWQHRYHLPLMFIFAVALPIIVAGLGWNDWWGGFLVAFALRLAYQYHVTWSINSLSHTFGEKFYDLKTSATDGYLWIFRHVLGLLTLGEVYHNFHHRFANDYRNGPNWYDLDVSKWLIKLLASIGATWDLVKRPASELARAKEEARLGFA